MSRSIERDSRRRSDSRKKDKRDKKDKKDKKDRHEKKDKHEKRERDEIKDKKETQTEIPIPIETEDPIVNNVPNEAQRSARNSSASSDRSRERSNDHKSRRDTSKDRKSRKSHKDKHSRKDKKDKKDHKSRGRSDERKSKKSRERDSKHYRKDSHSRSSSRKKGYQPRGWGRNSSPAKPKFAFDSPPKIVNLPRNDFVINQNLPLFMQSQMQILPPQPIQPPSAVDETLQQGAPSALPGGLQVPASVPNADLITFSLPPQPPLPGGATGPIDMANAWNDPNMKPELRNFFIQIQKNKASLEMQNSKCDRKLYIGNLPIGHPPQKIQMMLNSALKQLKINIEPGDSVVNMWIANEGNFGFAEFRTPIEATKALDGLGKVALLGQQLKVGRPSQYQKTSSAVDASAAAKFNITSGYNANGQFDISTLLQGNGAPSEVVGDIPPPGPTSMEEGQNSGPAPESVDINLNMLPSLELENEGLLHSKLWKIIVQIPTRILILKNMIGDGELIIEEEFKQIEEDINEECSKHGKVVKVTIPRPAEEQKQEEVREQGKIFVEYETIEAAREARRDLNGRLFSNRTVQAQYYCEKKYEILHTPLAPEEIPKN